MANEQKSTYVLADNARFRESISRRSIDGPFGAFFIPYLQPGLRVLDAGCGPGSITIGIARLVAPGAVVGVDLDEEALSVGRLNAATEGVKDLTFESADATALPFPDASFDRVFVSSLLEHLGSPQEAVAELFRVLKPGGIAGIGATAGPGYIYPPSPALEEVLGLSQRALRRNGGNPELGRQLRGLLLEGGFERVEAGASAIINGTDEQVRVAAQTLIDRSFGDRMLALMRDEGVTPEHVEELKQGIRAWGDHPHSVGVTFYGTAVAWKAE